MSPLLYKAAQAASHFGASDPACNKSGPLGFPTWYKYLNVTKDAVGKCSVSLSSSNGQTNFNQIWLIGLAVIDIILRIGVLVAIGYVIYGGFQYMLSQGEPDRTTSAKNTIINALVGLVITLLATAVVTFIGNKFGG